MLPSKPIGADFVDWVPDPIVPLKADDKIAQHFLTTLRRIIRDCYVDSFFIGDERANALLFLYDTLDWMAGTYYIGRVDAKSGDYLLDRDFIYSQIMESYHEGAIEFLPRKQAYFKKLYHMGVIRPHKHFSRTLISKMWLEAGPRHYFCVPYSIVNIDVSTLPYVYA